MKQTACNVNSFCKALMKSTRSWCNISVKGKGKGPFLELFQHWGHLAYCILAPNKFPHSSPEVPRIIQMSETSTSEGGKYYQILLANSNLWKSARIFYIPQSWDMGQILLLPLRRKAYWRFSGHPKNPTASCKFHPHAYHLKRSLQTFSEFWCYMYEGRSCVTYYVPV